MGATQEKHTGVPFLRDRLGAELLLHAHKLRDHRHDIGATDAPDTSPGDGALVELA